MKRTIFSFLALALFASQAVAYDWANDPDLKTLKAFPGAEGFGSAATGGRGGQIVRVTNLKSDESQGSFRWALKQSNPKIIVFDVSGTIELKPEVINNREEDLRYKGENFTIAGQTAPGDGIQIIGNKVNFGGSKNFIIQHIRFRVGDMPGSTTSGKGAIGIENAENFIIDHCTFGWSGEEVMTVYDNKNTTVQWSIIHESLVRSGHDKGDRGYGAQWGGSAATYHHNLLAHHVSRSPRFNGARTDNEINVKIDFYNNVNYNFGGRGACYGSDIREGNRSHQVNFVNNYWKLGPGYSGNNSNYFCVSNYGGHPTEVAKWYMSGNKFVGGSSNYASNIQKINNDNYAGLDIGTYDSQNPMPSIDKFKMSAFSTSYPRNVESADNAYKSVLAGAGAFPRDAVDKRIVKETQDGTASNTGGSKGAKKGYIDKPSDVGGYPTLKNGTALKDSDGDGIPDAWEDANGLDKNNASDGKSTSLMGGSSGKYTNVEIYIYDITAKKSDGKQNPSSSSSAIQSSSSSASPSSSSFAPSSSSANPQISGTLVKELSVTAATWSIQSSVQVGDSVHGDRTVTWTTLPLFVAGKEYIRTTVDPKNATLNNQATFKAGADITVSVLLDRRVIEPTGGDPRALPAWLSGWDKSEDIAKSSNDVDFYIYQKDFSEGETVTLGSNGSTTQSVVNYAVAVALQEGAVLPSSSSEGRTPILNSGFSVSNSSTLQYYNLRGESLGTAKPTKAGIYLVKQGSSVQKIVVK